MKKMINLLFVVLLLYSSTYAQNIFPSSGNVGVGTVSPVAILDIYSNVNTQTASLISIRSDFHTTGNYGMIRFGDYTQTAAYQKGGLIYESVSGSAKGKFHIALENTDGVGSVSLSDAKLTVLPDGNVGIGITNPQNKLDVSGTVHSKEVKVDMNGWADYVLKPTYKLPSLVSLKTYIDKNQHLPDIPSEAEAIKEGVKLGEMNKLLLKKVEEITLYMIQQHEEQKSLRRLLLRQKNQIDRLKKMRKLF